MSLHNKYITDITPYRVYRSIQPSIISGLRFAEQSRVPISFIITPDDPYLEVYSELEDRFVREKNKYFFDNVILIPASLEEDDLSDDPTSTNILSQEDKEVLNERSIVKFRQRIFSWPPDKLQALLGEPVLSKQQRSVIEKLLSNNA